MIVKIVELVLFVGYVIAAPGNSPAEGVIPLEKEQPTVIPIVSQSEEVESNGTFKFSYETGNGIKREETAYVKVVSKKPEGRSAGSGEDKEDTTEEIQVQQGSYSYTAPDGTLISIKYIADENGFQPVGSHIPTPPSPVAAVRGSEKSGRALSSDDSTGAASSPALQSRSASPNTAEGAAVAPTLNSAAAINVKTSESSKEEATTLAVSESSATAAAPSEASTTVAADVSAPTTVKVPAPYSASPKGTTTEVPTK